MRRAAIAAAAAALAFLAAAPAARAEDRPRRVGVVVADQVNISREQAEAIGAALGDGLRDALVIDVIAGAHAARRLPPDGVGELCVTRPDCVRDVAARLDADDLLFVVIVKLGSRVQVDPTWTDRTAQETASREAIVLDRGGQGAREAFAAAAPHLLPGAPRRDRAATGPAGAGGSAAGGGGAVGIGGAGGQGGADLVATPATTAPRGWRRIHTGTGIAGGVAVAALGGGIGFGLAARSDERALEEDGCGTRVTCTPSRIDALERKMLAADLLYGTALVSAAAAVVIQWRLGPTGEPAAAAPPPVAITAGSDAIGLAVGGRF